MYTATGKPYEENFQPAEGGTSVITKTITEEDTEMLSHVVADLEPSTLYEFLVYPLTIDGEGERQRIEVYTKGATGNNYDYMGLRIKTISECFFEMLNTISSILNRSLTKPF